MENTACGQNTTHGTLVVINQGETRYGAYQRKNLVISDKPYPVSMELIYHDDPVICTKSANYNKYVVDKIADLLILYTHQHHTRVPANQHDNAHND